MTDSTMSASIETRSRPPLSSSPRPRRMNSPSPSSSAVLCRLASQTSSARSLVILPSGRAGSCEYRNSAVVRPSTESPRNSRRS